MIVKAGSTKRRCGRVHDVLLGDATPLLIEIGEVDDVLHGGDRKRRCVILGKQEFKRLREKDRVRSPFRKIH